ncbi:hypothetical protein EII17_02170 [Clostridiales bacterium COT073_COT-073]|nr:hypothetical protein EII17_02170 [Clostridiales bacterium COT073_COT-073]
MDQKIGLYLQGGGAKGAFQVGALKALAEKGIDFDVIVGTSIGAINGMMIFYKGYHRLEELWLEMLKGHYDKDRKAPVLETREVVADIFKYLKGQRESGIEHFFVNYAPVENRHIRHEFRDLKSENDEKVQAYVRASSLLPNFYSWPDLELAGKTQQDIFRELIMAGSYDGYLLDGGLLNNRFLEPFLLTPVTTIYGIVFEHDFIVPDSIWEKYRPEQVIIIKPDFVFGENDSMLFSEENFKKWYAAGYQQAKITLENIIDSQC